jgi:hypothetical protein
MVMDERSDAMHGIKYPDLRKVVSCEVLESRIAYDRQERTLHIKPCETDDTDDRRPSYPQAPPDSTGSASCLIRLQVRVLSDGIPKRHW